MIATARDGARRMRFAARVEGIGGSPIDSSTSLLQRQTHDIVRFAMGSPAPEAIPAEVFELTARKVLSARDRDVYDYGPTEGEAGLRAQLLEFLEREEKVAPAPSELIITSGGMQGLDLTCKLFVDPGDVVAVESPTYSNGIGVVTSYGGEILEVPVDEEGLSVEALHELSDAKRRPRVIYTIPTFQNPSGRTLSLSRREALLETAERWGAVILEDDPYRQLRFGGESVPSLQQLAAGSVCVIGVHTFSKILAPGLRVGWVTANSEVVEKMVAAKQGLDTCTNVPMQRLVAAFIETGLLREHIDRIREEYRRRKEVMLEALASSLADLGASWTDTDGGFFLWLTLPEDIDTDELFPIALQEGVAFIPGRAFSAAGHFGNALRLCFASTDGSRTRDGVKRLRRAIDRYREGGAQRPGLRSATLNDKE